MTRRIFAIMLGICIIFFLIRSIPSQKSSWELGPFHRVAENPIISPISNTTFFCPIQKKQVRWESHHTFNPTAVVREGKVYLIYRAEDDYGSGIGKHTSRLGMAISDDGIHFKRMEKPILFPNTDTEYEQEFPGGCEDPRIVETDDGSYVMTYTQWNRKIARLSIAISNDLLHWKKHGYAFSRTRAPEWSKAGSIICRCEGDRMIATKIQGKYWMYWGEGSIHIATSDDLISWTPLEDDHGTLLNLLSPRKGKFDNNLVESGPPALIRKDGILLLYNGRNSIEEGGDPHVTDTAYSSGQALFDLENPTQLLCRSDSYFLTPQEPYETYGQYQGGTVFIEGLVHFRNKWFLYYGAADSTVGVASAPDSGNA